MCLSSTIYKIQQVICQKSLILPPHLHLALLLGATPFEFQDDLWHQKTRVPGLLCGIILCSSILIQYWLVMTDRQTQDDSIYRVIRACAVKISLFDI